MKLYLDDVKTHVDPCPHNGHSVGWTVMTETIVIFEALFLAWLINGFSLE